ncbi:hypothetical protein R3P38DRAFT_1240465 [Favolaschia claudopus]|uniref:MYND-type domain-containing protein n=1 Tax=Favolaschia claudopus TaxID=2862362 RepID=A0AAW0B2N7_9AGAR
MTNDASSAPPPNDDDRLPMFHDGLPSHVHPRCSHCLQVQRSYKTPLALCKACGMAMYCSKECQVSHWPSHKSDCKTHKAERLRLAQKTGSDTAFTDLAAWMRFHDATLKNCAIASMQLPSFSHMERKAVFCVYLRHEPGDLSQPPHKRFVIGTARRGNFPDDINPMSDLRGSLYLRYPQFCEEGRDEFGNNFYGVIRIGVFVVFGCDEEGVPDWITERYIHFSIDKETAKARRVARDVEGTLQEYVRRGERMRFCCGPIPGAKDVCCCGGLFDHSEFEKALWNSSATKLTQNRPLTANRPMLKRMSSVLRRQTSLWMQTSVKQPTLRPPLTMLPTFNRRPRPRTPSTSLPPRCWGLSNPRTQPH